VQEAFKRDMERIVLTFDDLQKRTAPSEKMESFFAGVLLNSQNMPGPQRGGSRSPSARVGPYDRPNTNNPPSLLPLDTSVYNPDEAQGTPSPLTSGNLAQFDYGSNERALTPTQYTASWAGYDPIPVDESEPAPSLTHGSTETSSAVHTFEQQEFIYNWPSGNEHEGFTDMLDIPNSFVTPDEIVTFAKKIVPRVTEWAYKNQIESRNYDGIKLHLENKIKDIYDKNLTDKGFNEDDQSAIANLVGEKFIDDYNDNFVNNELDQQYGFDF
jgi:hypothetical protein